MISRLLSECWFSHEDPIKVLKGKKLHLQCPKCHADLGIVLKGQRFRERKQPKKLAVVKMRKVG